MTEENKKWSVDSWTALITCMFVVLAFFGFEKFPLCNKQKKEIQAGANSGIINKENSSGNTSIQNSFNNSNNTNIINVNSANSAINYIENTENINTNVQRLYYTNDPTVIKKDSNGPVSLITYDESVQKKIYLNAEAFVKCTGEETYDFQFGNNSFYKEGIEKYTIDWGDGSKPEVLLDWGKKYMVHHKYKQGNNILSVTVEYKNNKITRKKYNVFVGSNPAGGFGMPGMIRLCLNDKATFMFMNSQFNPAWTLYTFTIDDGTEKITFLHPPPDSITYIFSKLSTPKNSFTGMLTIENPCGISLAKGGPFQVSQCN